MITVKETTFRDKTTEWLKRLQKRNVFSRLERYGERGVELLQRATPVETGVTAESWYYQVRSDGGWYTISWHNDNVVNGTPVVILIQYGHATRSGSWVQGRDFINPVIRPFFDQMVDDLWKEVTRG